LAGVIYGIRIQHKQRQFERINSYCVSGLLQIDQPHLELQHLNNITCSESSFQLSFVTYRAPHFLIWRDIFGAIFRTVKLNVELMYTNVICGTSYYEMISSLLGCQCFWSELFFVSIFKTDSL